MRTSTVKKMMSVAAGLIGVVMIGMVLTAHAQSDKQRSEIEQRIKPAGSACVEGDSGCGAVAAAAGGGAQAPEDVYNKHCMACHGTGAAGAPKFGDAGAWGPRIAKGKETLYKHALGGFNAMPAKGLCMDCSDDEIKGTVDYMVDHAK